MASKSFVDLVSGIHDFFKTISSGDFLKTTSPITTIKKNQCGEGHLHTEVSIKL